MIKLIHRYDEEHAIFKENDIVGRTFETDNQFDIWECILLKNKTTGEYSIFLTADSDEQWALLTFDKD